MGEGAPLLGETLHSETEFTFGEQQQTLNRKRQQLETRWSPAGAGEDAVLLARISQHLDSMKQTAWLSLMCKQRTGTIAR